MSTDGTCYFIDGFEPSEEQPLFSYWMGGSDNYLNGVLVVGGKAIKITIGRWSRPVEQTDAYGYLLSKTIKAARAAGLDVSSVEALALRRSVLLAEAEQVMHELSGPESQHYLTVT